MGLLSLIRGKKDCQGNIPPRNGRGRRQKVNVWVNRRTMDVDGDGFGIHRLHDPDELFCWSWSPDDDKMTPHIKEEYRDLYDITIRFVDE